MQVITVCVFLLLSVPVCESATACKGRANQRTRCTALPLSTKLQFTNLKVHGEFRTSVGNFVERCMPEQATVALLSSTAAE